jgi:hypothetical protein
MAGLSNFISGKIKNHRDMEKEISARSGAAAERNAGRAAVIPEEQ